MHSNRKWAVEAGEKALCKSFGSSSGGSRFNSQHPRDRSQLSIALFLGEQAPSFRFYQHQAHM